MVSSKTALERGPIVGAGVVCFRGDQVLLVRNARGVLAGRWSIPGGKVRFGETTQDAALRELREETSVEAQLVELIDVVDAIGPRPEAPDHHYVLVDFAARWLSGEPRPADDVDAAEFVPVDQALERVDWEPTRRVIRQAHARLLQPPRQ